jgi:hypothetical protein
MVVNPVRPNTEDRRRSERVQAPIYAGGAGRLDGCIIRPVLRTEEVSWFGEGRDTRSTETKGCWLVNTYPNPNPEPCFQGSGITEGIPKPTFSFR